MTEHMNQIEQIAAALGARPNTIRKWREASRGVPYRWRLAIIREAGRRGIMMSVDVFDAPKRKANARRG